MSLSRRRAVGAEVVSGGVHFRVAAPERRRVAVVLGSEEHELQSEGNGYFSAIVPTAAAGDLYRFRIDGGEAQYPDPASRFQPNGPHGPSQVVDPSAYSWREQEWRGVDLKGAVIYEMHIGTFTREGTYRSASDQLHHLRDVGINVIELMPLHEFPGRFGWGYDGVDLWAPTHLYGTPDDLRRFIDSCHGLGIAVILDVVYNHLGPDGCFLSQFTKSYFTEKYRNDWGEAINFDGDDAAISREFFCENAAYWIDEFRFDGLRLDATQSIFDGSTPHILRTIVDSARAAAGPRNLIVIGENEPQDAKLLREYGIDALWNDDWHHAAQVALTGRREAYYTDYWGAPQEFVSMTRFGFLYQGQRYAWQKNRRGSPALDIRPERFVNFLQNHDQIANSPFGQRMQQQASAALVRAMTALLLLSPQTPMLFQGQEFGASSPFLYFADHKPELADQVREGRREFLQQFPSIAAIPELPRPEARASFESSKLDHTERQRNRQFVELHRDLIRLRREDPTFREQRTDNLHGAAIGGEAFVLRWITDSGDDRLLLVNLGTQTALSPAPEPLLAHPDRRAWQVLWSSESPQYGGTGAPPPESEDGSWVIPAHAAIVLS